MFEHKLIRLIAKAAVIAMISLFGQIAVICTADAQQRYTLATSAPGGAWYPMAAGLTALYNQKIPGTVWTVEKGGGSSNNVLLSQKKVEFAWVSGDMIYYARDGKPPFDRKWDTTHFRSMVQLPISEGHWVVKKSSGIKKLEDLKGKRIAVMKRGSSGNQRVAQILETAAGIGEKDFTPEFIGDDQAVKALTDNRIDAFVEFIAAPAPPVVDISTTHDIDLLQLTPKHIQDLRKKYPWMTPINIPAGTYRGVPNEVASIGVPGHYLCLNTVSEDHVYQAVKILMENIEQLKKVHMAFGAVVMQPMMEEITGAKFHPGALKYYKEKGLR